MNRRFSSLFLLVLVTALLIWPLPVWSNMASPELPGSGSGEPGGGTKSLAIEHETLSIDLRPLLKGGLSETARAIVAATYSVRNDGPAQNLNLFFVAGSAVSDQVMVHLDGQPIAATLQQGRTVPESWQPPARTPGLRGGQGKQYHVLAGTGYSFALTLAPGRHDIRVQYTAKPSAWSDGPAILWQLGYVLAPAREWGSFGQLDVTVNVPPGWLAASEPGLSRDGDVLRGSFNGIPADTLALAAQVPVPEVANLTPFALIGGALATIVLGWLVGRWLGRHRRGAAWALPLSLLLAIAWVLAVSYTASPDRHTEVLPSSQVAWTYGYGSGMMLCLALPFLLVAGMFITQVSAFVACRRA